MKATQNESVKGIFLLSLVRSFDCIKLLFQNCSSSYFYVCAFSSVVTVSAANTGLR